MDMGKWVRTRWANIIFLSRDDIVLTPDIAFRIVDTSVKKIYKTLFFREVLELERNLMKYRAYNSVN